MKALESTAAWRYLGNLFLTVCVPLFHGIGGFFILRYILSGEYTWGRTLRTFVLFMGNLVMGYEFVYRDLQTTHPEWPRRLLHRSVMTYTIIPFFVGMVVVAILQVRSWGN